MKPNRIAEIRAGVGRSSIAVNRFLEMAEDRGAIYEVFEVLAVEDEIVYVLKLVEVE